MANVRLVDRKTGLLIEPIGTISKVKKPTESATVYHCIQKGEVAHYAKTEREALSWLSSNGGGIYKNSLHAFQFEVKPGDYEA